MPMIQFYFQLDDNSQTIERKVFSLLDSLAATGGLMGNIVSILGVIMNSI